MVHPFLMPRQLKCHADLRAWAHNTVVRGRLHDDALLVGIQLRLADCPTLINCQILGGDIKIVEENQIELSQPKGKNILITL